MADEVYYLDGSRNQQGPVPIAEIGRLIRAGAIRRDTLVWYAGMPDWGPAGQVAEFASFFSASAIPRPPAARPPSLGPAIGAAPLQRRAPMAAGAYAGQAPQAQAYPTGTAGSDMGFGAAVATCFRKYVDFTGRARRKEYWWWVLFTVLVSLVLGVVDYVIGSAGGPRVLANLANLAMLLPSISVAARRLHDTDRSGWWLLLGVLPLIGWIVLLVLMGNGLGLLLGIIPLIGWIVLLVFYCQRGTAGSNRFGPDPLGVDEAAEFE